MAAVANRLIFLSINIENMKKMYFLTLAAILLAAACKKDDDIPKNNADRLHGRWDGEKRIEVEYLNDREIDRDTSVYDGLIYEFKGDSLFLYMEGRPPSDRYAYTIRGEELVLRERSTGYFMGLKWHTNDRISLTEEEISITSGGARRRWTAETIYNRRR